MTENDPLELTEDEVFLVEGEEQQEQGESDEDIVARIHEFFERSSTHDAESRAARLEDLRFCALGEQWPAWAQRDRSIRGRERPMLVINRSKQYVTRAVNAFLEAMPQIKVRPIDDQADPKTANAMAEILRFIQDKSRADLCYGLAVEPQIREGVGYCRVTTQYADDTGFDQEIVILPVINPYSVYFDPDATMPDGSDGNACLIAEDMPRSEFERQYPGVETQGSEFSGRGDPESWDNKNTVRVAEYFEIVHESGPDLLMLEDGTIVEAPEGGAELSLPVIAQRKLSRKKCMWYKVAGSAIVERREMPTSMLPIVRFTGRQVLIDGKVHRYGMVRDLRSSQIQYNYQQSALTELVGLQPLAPYICASGQTEDFEDEWSVANRVPLTRLRYKPVTVAGNLAAAPARQPFAQVPQGALQLLQIAVDDMKAVTGQFNASQGAADESDQSGKAILAQQRQGDVALADFSIHANQAISRIGTIIVDMIPKVYTKPTLFRILGDDGTEKQVAINPQQQQAVQPMQGGPVDAIYNPGVGKYDVTVATGPSFQTRRAESAAMLMQLAQTFPPLMQVAGDLVVGSLDSPVSAKIADRLRPPGMQEDGKDISPEVLQMRKQTEQIMAQAEKIQQQLEMAVKRLDTSEEEMEIKRYQAMTDRLKVVSSMNMLAPTPGSMMGQEAILSDPVPQETDPQQLIDEIQQQQMPQQPISQQQEHM